MDKKGDATQRIYDVTVKRFKPLKGPPRLVIKHHNENNSSAESNKLSGKCLPKGPWGCDKCMIPFDSYNSCRNHMTDVHKVNKIISLLYSFSNIDVFVDQIRSKRMRFVWSQAFEVYPTAIPQIHEAPNRARGRSQVSNLWSLRSCRHR